MILGMGKTMVARVNSELRSVSALKIFVRNWILRSIEGILYSIQALLFFFFLRSIDVIAGHSFVNVTSDVVLCHPDPCFA